MEETKGQLIIKYQTLKPKSKNKIEWIFDDLGDENYQVVATPSWFTAIRVLEKRSDRVTFVTGSPGTPADSIDCILIKEVKE